MSTENPANSDSTAPENADPSDVEIAVAATGEIDETAETVDWEAIARDSAATLLFQALADVDESVNRVEHRLRGNANERITEDDVRAARNALYELEQVLEETVVPAVDGAEPYERSGEHVPFGALADRLGVDFDELEEARRA